MGQLSFMDDFYTKYKITKPIALIELFAGYGSQALSSEHLGVEHISHRICEWNAYSSIAYQHLHSTDFTDYSKELTKDEIVKFLHEKGVSLNWNAPATIKQLNNKKDEFLRETYNSIIATNNLVDVTKVHANDLALRERERWCVVMTYSFPCQDLSLAGKRGGMNRESGTRSSLLWEVERILLEMKEINQLPDILLLENVKELIGEKNIHNFNEWVGFLSSLGYETYTDVLNASDYGIPQHRERVFALSLRGEDIYYTFPEAQPLTKCLGDLLESNVDHKYFISDKMIKYISESGTENFKNPDSKINLDIARPLTTEQNKRAGTTNYISKDLPENYDLKNIKEETGVAIKNATKQGYLMAEQGDGIDISGRMEYHRGTVQKGKSQTISTMGGNNVGVIDKEPRLIGGYGNKGSDNRYHTQNRVYSSSSSSAITTSFLPSYEHNLAIRKLTPRECFRLMGLYDTDIDKIIDLFSDAILYHLAGDSIVVQVLEGIIGQMI